MNYNYLWMFYTFVVIEKTNYHSIRDYIIFPLPSNLKYKMDIKTHKDLQKYDFQTFSSLQDAEIYLLNIY